MKHILIDLDGTLTDPKEGIVACIEYALEKLGIAVPDSPPLESYIGPPLLQTFRELCHDDVIAEEGVRLYRERFTDQGLYENRVFDGIRENLQQLRQAQSTLYVATSKPTVYSQRIIDHFGLNTYFKHVYGSELDGTRSDKTDLLAHIISTEKIAASDAVMIGDRRYDIVGANNHGMRSVGVLWGYGSEDELRDAGATALCAQPASLFDTVAKLFEKSS
ncbi:MAG: HAD family hydrolase [Halioglobus sp.]